MIKKNMKNITKKIKTMKNKNIDFFKEIKKINYQ